MPQFAEEPAEVQYHHLRTLPKCGKPQDKGMLTNGYFKGHEQMVEHYRSCPRIGRGALPASPRLYRHRVEGTQWPDPRLNLHPRFDTCGAISELVGEGLLHLKAGANDAHRQRSTISGANTPVTNVYPPAASSPGTARRDRHTPSKKGTFMTCVRTAAADGVSEIECLWKSI